MRTKVPTVMAILALVFATTLVVAAVPSGEARAEESAARTQETVQCGYWFFEEWYKITCGVSCGAPGLRVVHREWIEREWCQLYPTMEWFPTHNLRWRYEWFCAYCESY